MFCCIVFPATLISDFLKENEQPENMMCWLNMFSFYLLYWIICCTFLKYWRIRLLIINWRKSVHWCTHADLPPSECLGVSHPWPDYCLYQASLSPPSYVLSKQDWPWIILSNDFLKLLLFQTTTHIFRVCKHFWTLRLNKKTDFLFPLLCCT